MNPPTTSRLVLLAAILVCASASAARQRAGGPAAAYVDGSVARLTPAHVAKLRRLNAPVAIPTYVPVGFRVTRVVAKLDTKTAAGVSIVDYEIHYAGPRNRTFTIYSANEGLGDLFLEERTLTGSNPYMNSEIIVGYTDDDVDGRPEKEIASQWVGCQKRFQTRRDGLAQQFYRIHATHIPLREAVKIMESLRYLRR